MDVENFIIVPYTVIIDTREQSAYDFRNLKADKKDGGGPLLIKTDRKALATGDYSIEGLQNEVAIERKELGDFLHCVGTDRERFKKQLARLQSLQYGAVMVEADWLRVLRGTPHSKLNPKSISRSVIGWQMDDFPGVHWWFVSTKRQAEQFTFRILDRYYRKHGSGTNEQQADR